jgi:hypothetical protein
LNLSEYRTRIARVTGMSTAAAGDLSLMDSWVNEGVVQFLRETKYNVRRAALAMTAGSGDYSLDTDILALQAAYYQPTGADQRLLIPVTPERMMELRLPNQSGYSTVQNYAMAGGNTIMLWASPPASTDILHVLYVPRPAVMSVTSDSPSDTAKGNIPAEYHPVIEAYAKWKAASAEEHKGSDNGLQFQAEWERAIAKVRGEMFRKAGGVQPAVRIGRGSPFVPPGNGVDMGY